jgi:hypothetical protein
MRRVARNYPGLIEERRLTREKDLQSLEGELEEVNKEAFKAGLSEPREFFRLYKERERGESLLRLARFAFLAWESGKGLTLLRDEEALRKGYSCDSLSLIQTSIKSAELSNPEILRVMNYFHDGRRLFEEPFLRGLLKLEKPGSAAMKANSILAQLYAYLKWNFLNYPWK